MRLMENQNKILRNTLEVVILFLGMLLLTSIGIIYYKVSNFICIINFFSAFLNICIIYKIIKGLIKNKLYYKHIYVDIIILVQFIVLAIDTAMQSIIL